MRITKEQIQRQIDIANSQLGLKRKYIKSKAQYTGNEIELSGAYGGWKAELSSGHDVTDGFVSKSELYFQLKALNKGIEMYKKRNSLKKK